MAALLSSASPTQRGGAHKRYCPPHPISAAEQRAVFNNYVYEFFVTRNITKAFEIVDPSYIQHNPSLPDGPQAAIDFLTPIMPSQNITVVHTALQDNIGYIHWKDQGLNPRTTAIVDILRFEGGCIMEHWDVIQEVPANAVSSHPLF